MVYSPGSSGVKDPSPSPSIFTSNLSIATPCMPSLFVRETVTSSPAATVYSSWSNSKLDAVILSSLLAVPDESLSVLSVSPESPLSLPPHAARNKKSPRASTANNPFFISTLLNHSYYFIFQCQLYLLNVHFLWRN